MMVSVALPDRDFEQGGRIVLTAQPAGGMLTHEAHLGAGVHLGVDLMSPDRWCSISVATVDDTAKPLLQALIGERAVRGLREFVAAPFDPAKGPRSMIVEPGSALPWIRVAVVDALDRWLQLPLDQPLVDAERGVSRGIAARTLPPDAAARRLVVGEALQLTRQASGGVVRYLRTLGSRRALPLGLVGALRSLVEGYTGLVDEVSGPDRALTAVLDAWRTLSEHVSIDDQDEAIAERPGAVRRRSRRPKGSRLSSMIDPRRVQARVFAMSADPASGEVMMADADLGGGPAVLVRVPAYRRALDLPVVQRLLVRLVDAESADPRSEPVLIVPPMVSGRRRGSAQVYFEGVVPLHGSSVESLRADVFDALSPVPPASADTDRMLHEVRRATLLLSEWRRLVACAQLPVLGLTPAKRVRELVQRLAPAGNDDQPLFAGGPSAADLGLLAAGGDGEIIRRALALTADDGATGSAAELFATVRGSGRLLAAEVAAVDTDPSA
jgi:hypothetical protein